MSFTSPDMPVLHPAWVRPWTGQGGRPLGYTISSDLVGPTLVIYGQAEYVRTAYERLAALAGLSRIRGTLVLAYGAPDFTFEADALIDLSQGHGPQSAHRNYWTILSHCADLGMISGRGVTQRSRRSRPVLQTLVARLPADMRQHS